MTFHIRIILAVSVSSDSSPESSEPTEAMALDALDAFAGRVVLYAGEPRGGANGDALFFDKLEAHFFVREVVALDPFPGGAEKLYVLERRPWWWRRGLIRRKTTPV